MRWAVTIASVVGVAGCDTPGVNVEVIVNDPAITQVELFVGRDCGDNCPGAIAPPMLGRRQAKGFLVNDSQRWHVDVNDGVARFRIAAAADELVPIVVAVGVDLQLAPVAVATLRDVHVSANDGVYWRLELAKAEPIADLQVGDAPPGDGSEGVALWRPMADQHPACVLVEHWRDGAATREFIVPEDDTDCDDVVMECDPWAYLSTSPPTIRTADCLVSVEAATASMPVCMIGGPSCSETMSGGGPTGCTPVDEDYCVTDKFCACMGSPGSVLPCVIQTIDNNMGVDGVPRFACDIPLDNLGNACPGGDKFTGLDLAPLLRNSTLPCTSVEIRDLADPLPFDAFDDAVQLTMGTLTVKNLTAPCKFDVGWSGRYTGGSIHLRHLIAAIEMPNGKHLVVPFNVVIGAKPCGSPMMCTAEAGFGPDSIYECVAATSSCQPSNGCTTGPMCGVACCGVGETCSNGVCKCGFGSECQPGQTCASSGPVFPDQCGRVCCGNGTPCPV